MSQLLCCCFQKKFKRKQISTLKPHQAYLSFNPNEYVLEDLNTVPQQTFTKNNVYYDTIPNEIIEIDDDHLSPPEIPSKQQSFRTLTRQIQSYPPSPKRQDNDDVYISSPGLECSTQNTKLFYDRPEIPQHIYKSKPKTLRNSLQKQSNDHKKLPNSEYIENEEPFPYKIDIGERKFTSVIYESPPVEVLQDIQKKIQEQRLLESLTEKLEKPLFCDFSFDNNNAETSCKDDSRKWKQENGHQSSYLANSQKLNGKMYNEEIYVRQETQNMIPEKDYNHEIFKEQVPESSSCTSPVMLQKSSERGSIPATSNKYSESNKKPLNNDDENLVYITALKQNEGKCKPIINSLPTKLQVIPRKVIRHSRDNDIFVEQKQHLLSDKTGPRYINVGKGSKIHDTENELFVTDYLNQFSSIFVDNLKDPIPKDPLSQPRSHNIYVPPNSATQLRKVPDRNVKKHSLISYNTQDSKNRNQTFRSKIKHGFNNFTKHEQSDSPSNIQSEQEQRKFGIVSKKPTYEPPRKSVSGIKRENVNTALVENKRDVFSYPSKKSIEYLEGNMRSLNKSYLSSDEEEESNDETLHGLRCIGPNKEMDNTCSLRCYSNTSHETSDSGSDDERTDVFSYDTASEASSGTNKLRWKIVIKRGNENS